MPITTSNFSTAYEPAPTSTTSSPARQINHMVELAPDLSDATSVRSLTVPPSEQSTRVVSYVRVQASGARALRSAQYVASQRRIRASRIRAQIHELSSHSGNEDFTSYTFPVVDDLRKAISYLDEFQELEGNSSAVLRHVRNTFFDGGWLLYKSANARDAAATVLSTLLVEEPIEPEVVKGSFRLLVDAGLRPFLPSPIDDWGGDDDGSSE